MTESNNTSAPSRIIFIIGSVIAAIVLLVSLGLILNSAPNSGGELTAPTSTVIVPTVPCAFNSIREPISTESGSSLALIIHPMDCSSNLPITPNFNIVSGTYSQEIENKKLWVLVYPPNGLYYPQGEIEKTSDGQCNVIPTKTGNGQWSTKVFLGTPNLPEQFDIVLVMTEIGSEADENFTNWLKTGCETGDFSGFTRSGLGTGLTELDAVTVQTS